MVQQRFIGGMLLVWLTVAPSVASADPPVILTEQVGNKSARPSGARCTELLRLDRARKQASGSVGTIVAQLSQIDEDWKATLPHCATRARIQRLITKAKIEPTTLEVSSTVGWGCSCPPFAVTSESDVLFDEQLIYPAFASSRAGAYLSALGPGRYRLTGYFTGTHLNEMAWDGKVNTHSAQHPIFLVQAICQLKGEETAIIPRC